MRRQERTRRQSGMRKLLHQAFGVLKHGQSFDPTYALTH